MIKLLFYSIRQFLIKHKSGWQATRNSSSAACWGSPNWSSALLAFIFLNFGNLQAQVSPDSLMQQILKSEMKQSARISTARLALREAFEQEDFGQVNAWLGFLENNLDSADFATTSLDERWLLFFWTNNFSQLFAEIVDFENIKSKFDDQIVPREDSLFERVDLYSFQNRHEIFRKIRENFLSEEEQAFAVLTLDWLLREDQTEPLRKIRNEKSAAFLKKYPQSRFRDFVYRHLYDEVEVSPKIFGVDFFFNFGKADGAHGINFKPLFGGEMDVFFEYLRIRTGITARFGGQNVRRSFQHKTKFIEPDSTAAVIDLGWEFGYRLVRAERFSVYPSLGNGISILSVSESIEFGEKVVFTTFYSLPALNLDFKLGKKPALDSPTLRFRLGYKLQNFGKKNAELAGNQILVSIGIGFSQAKTSKKKI